MLRTPELFDVKRLPDALQPLLDVEFPWEVLGKLDAFLATIMGESLGEVHPTAVIEGTVFLAEGASVGPHALVQGPAWIGAGAEVGHAAFLRGGVVLAPGAKVGHSSEVKHALMMSGAKAPHFNYVGDAVVGHDVNLGAGAKLANFNTFGHRISIEGHDTGLRKFSAVLGDEVSIGCNAVLAPGTIVGQRSVIYSGVMARGVIPADTVLKLRQSQERTGRM
jgi:bifunctional N-acetylglucosamine-1-phosphate-uridyltransferase/glucosamine-1-phosphate-acetyltransferase GlmU-like protein